MYALVCIGGDAPPAPFLRNLAAAADLVIAADSGLSIALDAGLRVDHAIGDMDSLADPSLLAGLPPDRVHRHPPEKDYTDTELAIALAWKLGADRVALAGGGGGRLDHLLAIRALFDRARAPDEWHTALESAYLVRPGASLDGRTDPGALVSVFPCFSGEGAAGTAATMVGTAATMAGAATTMAGAAATMAGAAAPSAGMESEGLAWGLRGLAWGPGDYGVSNRCTSGSFRVRAGTTPLLVIVGFRSPDSGSAR